MSVSHVGTTNATGTTTATAALPVGWAIGDVLFIVAEANVTLSTPTLTGPTGYTLIRNTLSSTMRHATWWKVAASGETAQAVTASGTSITLAVICTCLHGTNATLPQDVENGQANTSSVSTTAPGVTTTVANDAMIHTAGSANRTHTPPTGYTEPTNGDLTNGVGASCADSYLIGQAAGATGNVVGTLSSAIANIAHLVGFFQANSLPPFRRPNTLVRM